MLEETWVKAAGAIIGIIFGLFCAWMVRIDRFAVKANLMWTNHEKDHEIHRERLNSHSAELKEHGKHISALQAKGD